MSPGPGPGTIESVGSDDASDDQRLPSIGLVLGGGGIAGYAYHCGALTALDRFGLDPRTAELIVGTSAGAIVGALLRGQVPAPIVRDHLVEGLDDPDEMALIRLLAGRSTRAIPQVWTGPSSPRLALRELRKGSGLRLTRLAAGLLPHGRLDLDPVTARLEVLHRERWPRQAFWVTATDLDSGRRLVFGRDGFPRVAEAVQASASLPGFFAPTEIGDRRYVDGGIGSPFNADLADQYRTDDDRPLDLVIVLAPLSSGDLGIQSPLSSAARALPQRRLRREVTALRQAGVPTLVLEPDRGAGRAMGLNPMAYRGLHDMVDEADRAATTKIEGARAELADLLERGCRAERPPAAPYPEAEPDST